MAPAAFAESALLSPLSATEKLLVAQAVYQVGTVDYVAVAKLLHAHPLLELAGRPHDFFPAERAKELFEAMLGEKDIGLDPSATYVLNSPPLLKVAKKYYMQRVYELRALMQLEEDKFRITYSEIQEIKSGAWDFKIDDPEPPPLSTRPTPTPTPSGTPAGTPVPEISPKKVASGKRGRESVVDGTPGLAPGGEGVKVEEDAEVVDEPLAGAAIGEDVEMGEA